MRHIVKLAKTQAFRIILVAVGLCVSLGASEPAYATHFRYGNLTWVPTGGRAVNFELTDAFRRSASPSFDPCVSPTSITTVIPCTGTGLKFCASGTNVGAQCTINSNCSGGGVCSPLHGVGDLIREDIGGTQLDFGDGSHTPTGSTPLVYKVTSVDTTNNWSFVAAVDPAKLALMPAGGTCLTQPSFCSTDIAHTYAGTTSSFTAKVDDCCRISASVAPNGHINNPDKQYLLTTLVTFTGDTCPVSTEVPIVNCPINAVCTFNVPASDANGDTLHWRLASASEASAGNDFVQPGPPNAPNAASINANTGLYTWNTTGATLAGGTLNTLYSTQVIIEDLSASPKCVGGTNAGASCTVASQCPGGGSCTNVKCRTPVDFLIQLVPQVNQNHPPTCTAPSPQNVTAGSPVSFVASGADPDVGDTVTLNAAGVPAGATQTPPLPVGPATTVSSTFNWTPGANDVGPTVIQYSVTDSHNVQTLCSVTINVACNLSLCSDGNSCTDDTCGVSGCLHINNTVPCDDGNACTTNDTCGGGTCNGGAALVCNDNNVCTTDTCNAQTGCVFTNNTNPCNDGNACTTNDVCGGGTCHGGAPLSCNDNNVCTTDTCNAQTGCVFTNNTAPCSDNDACTLNDTCSGGSCLPGLTANCDDNNACTTDSCTAALGCQHVSLPNCQPCQNNSDCSNNNACDGDEQCVANKCQSGTPPNCDDGNLCTDDGCNPASGCTHLNNNNSCDDGNACTTADACSAGSCHGGPALICNDNNVCTDDTCNMNSGCVYTNNTASCDDSNACTTNDTCANGTCHGGAALTCDDGNVCTTDSCNMQTGCVFANNTDPCNDGDACTTNDVCGDGICNGGPPPICNDNNPCTDDDCDPQSGCTFTPNDRPCDDGHFCTSNDRCDAGQCVPGGPTDCSDGNGCTDDTCNDGLAKCEHADNTAPCDDGNGCTLDDVCAGGQCTPGTPKDCNDLEPCTDDSCNAPSGVCVNTPNSNTCDDGNACTTGDVCSGGTCQSGAPLNCDDGNLCTDDGCNPASGCTHLNNNNSCNDGNACTTNDACSAGSCHGGPALSCNDNNVCTDDTCNVNSGCVFTPNTASCSDANACTLNDACSGGSCVPGPAADCNDNNACTTDSCSTTLGCQHVTLPNCQPCVTAADCDNHNACDGVEQCVAGKCQSGTPPNCNDNNGCTDDGCDAATGCTHLNNNAPCNDGNACTTNDACSLGNCVGGPPPNCNNNNVCTTDTCNPQTGCVHTNNTNPCSDGSECTVGDMCHNGACVPGPAPSCNDNNPCTDDTCNANTPGGCVHTDNTAPCDDGDPCTVNDVCGNHQCAGQPRDCADEDPCTIDSCDNQGGGFLCLHQNCYNLAGHPCPPNLPQCIPGICGNGRIDDPRETCDPPDGTPIPGVVPPQPKCRPDCTFCGDGRTDTADGETCDDGNQVSGCDPVRPTQALDGCQLNCTVPICRDPAKILFSSPVDVFKVHARLATDSLIDFSGNTFVVELTDDSHHVIYRASLEADALVGSPDHRKFTFKDKTARLLGGFGMVKIKFQGSGVLPSPQLSGNYRVTALAYGDLRRAQVNMVTHVYRQDDEWTLVGSWEKLTKGWRFTGR